jgi:hypothetical protein
VIRAGWVAVGLTLAAGGAAAQAPAEPADLVRCNADARTACLVTTTTLDVDAIRQTAGRPEAELSKAFRARFRGDTALVAVGRRAAGRGTMPAARILVLVDVSGSMKSDFRFVYTLSALRFFLNQLDSLPAGVARVAVAAFGSRGVRQGIAAARFVPPDSVRGQVDAIRAPDRENTGLFSAIQAGIERLETELSAAGDPNRGHLVVITDGNNQVLAGDDPGLLDGQGGLATAAAAVSESRAIVTIIGIGNLNRGALETLAGERGRVALVTDAQFKLSGELSAVKDLLASAWEVAVPMAWSREDLGRSFGVVRTRLVAGGGQFQTGAFAWVPPLVALPAFVGALGGVSTDQAVAAPRLDGRWVLAAMLAVSLLFLWWLVPNRIWPVPADPAAQAAKPAAAKVPAAAQGLRLDVKEVAPRKLTDVTASRARRV